MFMQKNIDGRNLFAKVMNSRLGHLSKPKSEAHHGQQNSTTYQRQKPIDPEHPEEDINDQYHIAQDVDGSAPEHVIDGVDIRSKTSHQPAHRIPIIELDWNFL